MSPADEGSLIDSPQPSGNQSAPASTLGMTLFILSLSMLFAASLAAYYINMVRAPVWPPEGMPPLPLWLYLSTFLIIGSSMTIQLAHSNARIGRLGIVSIAMLATLVLGLLFLGSQIVSWSIMLQAEVYAKTSMYSFIFYMLTGLHAAHVIGGVVPLVFVTRAAYMGHYTKEAHLPVKHMTMYWHFLGIVWLIMFLTFVFTS